MAAPLANPPAPAVAAGVDQYVDEPELYSPPVSATPRVRELKDTPIPVAAAPLGSRSFLNTVSVQRWRVDPQQIRRALGT